MTIKLYKPLSKNGKYFLYSKVGNDGNTLLNKCGFPMNEFDTIQLNVTGCFNAIYEMENVTIEEDQNPVVEWSADTSSYPDYLFQEWQIFRKDPGQAQYQKVGTVFNQYKYDFKDNQIGFIKVDQDSYEYRVDMKLNDDMQGETNSIESMLLERSNGMVPIIDPDTGEVPVDTKGRRSYSTSMSYCPSIKKHVVMGYLPTKIAIPGKPMSLEYFNENGDGVYPMTVQIVGKGSIYDPENKRVRA